jgi:hypothetical protein
MKSPVARWLCVLAAATPWLASGDCGLASPPTDIVAVDEFIDAPRALFGRTAAAVQRTLGEPAAVRARAMLGASTERVDLVELTYPGVVIALGRASSTLRRVEITQARWALPRGLNVGVPRERVEAVLGEPQLASDVSVLYLYSDAYPDTVEFFFRGDRVQRIEWLYAPAD